MQTPPTPLTNRPHLSALFVSSVYVPTFCVTLCLPTLTLAKQTSENNRLEPSALHNPLLTYQMPSVDEINNNLNQKKSSFEGESVLPITIQPKHTTQPQYTTTQTHPKSQQKRQNTTPDTSIISQTDNLLKSNSAISNTSHTDEEQQKTLIADVPSSKRGKNLFQKAYAKLQEDGVLPTAPQINVIIYQPNNKSNSQNRLDSLIEVDTDKQPMKNIKSALEDIYADTLTDFQAGLPSIKKTAYDAAEVVGYYETKMRFLPSTENMNELSVIIDTIGEPAVVNSRIIDIRGEGEKLPEFELMKQTLQPQQGEPFNQGEYVASKTAINLQSRRMGFFDKKWLNHSAEVLLPDNTVDMTLIADTGKRYQFGDVVFFTHDKSTGQLTSNPEKLPVKPALLKQLLGFESGDPYLLDKVEKLQASLSATQYFNIASVEEVLPSKLSKNDTQDSFKQSSKEDNNNALLLFEKTDKTNKESGRDKTNNLNNTTNVSDNVTALIKNQVDGGMDEDIAPINFSVDADIVSKYADISQKANRLLSMPDNSMLNEQQHSQSILGQLSDDISGVVKAILPKETQVSDRRYNTALLAEKKTAETVQKNKEVPLYVLVVADKPYDAQIGVGYGTDTGYRATARLDNHLVNKEGYQSGISAEISGINQKINLHGSRPFSHPLNDTLSGRVSYENTLINQGNTNNEWQTKTLQASISRNRVNEKGWNRSYSLRHKYDELDIGSDAQANPQDLPVRFSSSSPVQQATLLGYSMNKTVTDNVTNPSKGYRQYYSIEAGSDQLLTDTNMVIARMGASGIYSFGDNKQHQVIGKANAGYVWADDFTDVPYTLRFFAGGDRSIRGYDYNSLSPMNDSGYLTGGNVLAVGSGEYNYQFKEGLRGAIFADVGNAYGSEKMNDTKVGLGMGVRWASPIGSVRLDIAAGVSEDDSVPIRLHLFVGSPL